MTGPRGAGLLAFKGRGGWEGEGVPSEGNFLSFFWIVLCHISILISLLVQWLTESRFGKVKFGIPIEKRSLMSAGIGCRFRLILLQLEASLVVLRERAE